MSIVDSKVVITVDAETKGAQRNMELLRAQQQHFAAEVVKGLESQNKKLESSISKWAAVGAAVVSLGAAYKLAKAGIDEFHKASELAQATQGVNLAGLQKAARGLKSDMELLSFASKTNAGAFKLTNEQMQIALKAMEVYEDRGHNAAKVTDAITDALIKADTKGLRQFGVQIYEGGTKAEKFQAIIKALTKDVYAAGEASDVGADAWQRQGVSFENAMSKIKQSIGEIVIAMAPLIEKVARLAKGIADSLGNKTTEVDARLAQQILDEENLLRQTAKGNPGMEARHREWLWQHGGKSPTEAMTMPLGKARLSRDERERLNLGTGGTFTQQFREAQAIATAQGLAASSEKMAQDFAVAIEKRRELAAKKGKFDRGSDPIFSEGTGGTVYADGKGADLSVGGFGAPGSLGAARAAQRGGLGGFGAGLERMGQGAQWQRFNDSGAANSGFAQSQLAKMFGPIEEFDAYGKAMSGLTGTFATGFEALISGSEGAGKAMKRFLAGQLMATSIELGIQAIKHLAFAAGSLAFYDYSGAARHGVAAAKFGAGALAAGVGARMLGGGGGGAVSAGGGGGAVPTSAAGTGSGGGTRTVIVATGNDFNYNDSPRQRLMKARQLVSAGLSEAGDGVRNG